jgi:hypothetical protein
MKINETAHNISKALDEMYYGKSTVVGLPYIPSEEEYLYQDSDCLLMDVRAAEFLYKNPRTGEMLFFDRKSNYKGLIFVRQVSSVAPYGLCPFCGDSGYSRERRPDGYDVCKSGHNYRSSRAIQRDKIGSLFINRPFHNKEVENGYSVYVKHEDSLLRIDFLARESEGSAEINTPKYWSNKVGKFNEKTKTNT